MFIASDLNAVFWWFDQVKRVSRGVRLVEVTT
jgi:hypothetical protein